MVGWIMIGSDVAAPGTSCDYESRLRLYTYYGYFGLSPKWPNEARSCIGRQICIPETKSVLFDMSESLLEFMAKPT